MTTRRSFLAALGATLASAKALLGGAAPPPPDNTSRVTLSWDAEGRFAQTFGDTRALRESYGKSLIEHLDEGRRQLDLMYYGAERPR